MQHPSAALDDALEQKAAYIEGGASPDTSSLGMQQSHVPNGTGAQDSAVLYSTVLTHT